MSTPNARANRNRIEAQLGSHRHGRPSKLEFRKFGERHGGNLLTQILYISTLSMIFAELKEEKIVPHKDKW